MNGICKYKIYYNSLYVQVYNSTRHFIILWCIGTTPTRYRTLSARIYNNCVYILYNIKSGKLMKLIILHKNIRYLSIQFLILEYFISYMTIVRDIQMGNSYYVGFFKFGKIFNLIP